MNHRQKKHVNKLIEKAMRTNTDFMGCNATSVREAYYIQNALYSLGYTTQGSSDRVADLVESGLMIDSAFVGIEVSTQRTVVIYMRPAERRNRYLIVTKRNLLKIDNFETEG